MDNRVEIILAAKDITGQAFAKVQKQVGGLTKSIFSLNGAIVSMAGGYGLGRLAGSFLQTARDFERFQIQLETITGSSIKAKASMDWIADFTKTTPYELGQVTDAFVKLEAYGLSGTRWMTTLGDTASSMGKGLNQAVEMFADAVTGEFERLKEFGVKASTQGDQVTFRWSQNGKDMVVSTQKTASGISGALEQIFSRFSGGMVKQASTLDGILSNISDQFTMLQKTFMDAGVFEEVKVQVQGIADGFQMWVASNEDLIRQKVPEYVGNIKTAFDGLLTVASAVGGVIERISNTAAGFGMVAGGQLSFWKLASSNAGELKKIIKDFDQSYEQFSPPNKSKAPVGSPGRPDTLNVSKSFDPVHAAYVNYDKINMTDKEQRMMVSKDMVDETKKRLADITKAGTDTADAWKNAFDGWASGFSATLNDMLWGGEMTFGNMGKAFAKMLTQMMIQVEIVDPMKKLFTGGGGFDLKGLFGSLGGIFGTGTAAASVPWFSPAGVPHFDTGGVMGPDGLKKAFPAVLHEDEIVGTADQMKSMFGKKDSGTNIMIHAVDAKSFNDMVRRNPAGIISVIDQAISGNGSLRQTIGATL